MEGWRRQVWQRLPLARAAFTLLQYVLAPPFLEGLFEAHRQRCYERELSFTVLVELIQDALLLHRGSLGQVVDRRELAGRLPVAKPNVYGKLGRLPVEVAQALLVQGAARLGAVWPAGAEVDGVPQSLRGLAVVLVDGKKLKGLAKRLKVLRGLPGQMLGGKLLVALEARRRLVLAFSADPDGERNDVPLVAPLLPQVRAALSGPILWVQDRQFCDLNLPALWTQGGDHFLVRYSRKLHFHPDAARPEQEGRNAAGQRWRQRWGWIGAASDARRRYVRQITLERPGQEDVTLLTDLLDQVRYAATDLLAVYLQRWGIETVFQQVTEVFGLQRLIGSTPQGAIFQGAWCLLLYNVVQVAKAWVAVQAERRLAEVSGEKLFYDLVQQLVTWAVLGGPALWAPRAPVPSDPAAVQQVLAQTLRDVWTERWRKAPPQKRRPQPQARVPPGHGGHASAWRLIQAAQQRTRS
jgi:hypothetical protein